MRVSSYNKELNKLILRARRKEEEVEMVPRYLSGLRQGNQDEISMIAIEDMHKLFQLALREEEKARRRHDPQQRGRSNRGFKSRGKFGT